MDRHKGIFLPGESSKSQTNAPASSAGTVPVLSSTIQTSTPAPNSQVLPGDSSKVQINAPVFVSKADTGQRSSVQIDAAAPDHVIFPAHNSFIQNNATAHHSGIFIGQSSHCQTDAAALNSQVIQGQISNSQINPLTFIFGAAPAVPISDAAPGELSNMQINVPATNSEADPGQSSQNQTDVPVSNPETIPPIAGPSTLRLEEDTTEPTNTHPENDHSDSSSDDESVTSEEPAEVQEWRRKLAYYKELYERTYGKKYEERADGSKDQCTYQPTTDMPSQAKEKGKGKRKADDTTNETSTKTEGKKKPKFDRTSGMSPQEKLEYHHAVLKRYFEEAMEKANMLGYAYGIVLEDDTVLTGCSESLRKWWEETVRFEQAGPAAANKYILENQAKLATVDDNEPPQRTYSLLMKLSDGTLASVLSSLVWKCRPPQRKFPFKKKATPPWWPKGDESWWVETGEKKPEKGELQYKKPHDIKKKWKAIIVLSVLKHLAPQFDLIMKSVKASKNLQDRLTVREMEAWNFALKEEMKIYCKAHPDVPLSDLLKAFQFRNARVPAPQQRQVRRPVENQSRENRFRNRNRNVLFPCENKGCVHNKTDSAFKNAAARDIHRPTCKRKTQKNPAPAPAPAPDLTPAPAELQPIFPPVISTSNTSEAAFRPFGSTSQENVTPLRDISQVAVLQLGSDTEANVQQFDGNYQENVTPLRDTDISQVTVPQLGSDSQADVQQFDGNYQEEVPPFDSTAEGTALPFNSTAQASAPPIDQQIFQAPSQPLTAPVESSLLELIGQNLDTNLAQRDWEPSDHAGLSSYEQSAPTGSHGVDQWHPGSGFGGYYSGPGSSSAGGVDDYGLGSSIGTYLRMLNDAQQNAMMMPLQEQLHSAENPPIYQHHLDDYNFVGGSGMPMSPREQLYEEDSSVQHALFDYYEAREDSSSEAPQQTGNFQPFEYTEMQLFPDDRAVETSASDIPMNDQLPEAAQFGQIDPTGDFFTLSQPHPPVVPDICIPPASDLQQNAPQDVQTPVQQSAQQDAQNPAPSEELNQFSSGNDEQWPDWSFFQ